MLSEALQMLIDVLIPNCSSARRAVAEEARREAEQLRLLCAYGSLDARMAARLVELGAPLEVRSRNQEEWTRVTLREGTLYYGSTNNRITVSISRQWRLPEDWRP